MSTTTLARPKMVSKATQVGGIDQATQTDLPCLRCMHGPPQHHLPPGALYHPQYYPNYYYHQQQFSPHPFHQTQQQQPQQHQQIQKQQQHLNQHQQLQQQPQQQPPPKHGWAHNDWRQYQPPAPTAPQHSHTPSLPPQSSSTQNHPHHDHHHQTQPSHPQALPPLSQTAAAHAILPRPAATAQPPPSYNQQTPDSLSNAAAPVPPRQEAQPPAPLPGPPTWDKMVLGRTWDSLEDAENDIKNFAEFLGFALVRRRSGNRDPETGKPTRIHYCCHLDAARKPVIDPAERKRKRESASSLIKRQDGCPWQICLKWNKRRGNQPHLFHKWHLIWTGGTESMRSREHNHEMDPDPANIPANRRRHITPSIRDEVVSLLDAGGMSSGGVCEIMQRRHPRIAFNKATIDNMRRAELHRREEEARAAAAGTADKDGQEGEDTAGTAGGGQATGTNEEAGEDGDAVGDGDADQDFEEEEEEEEEGEEGVEGEEAESQQQTERQRD